VDSSTALVVGLAAVLVLAGVMIIATGRRRAGTGRLSRETRKADAPPPPSVSTELATTAETEAELDDAARARAEETSRALEPAGARVPAERVPVDEEELGVTRRQFFNRGILLGQSLAVGGFGVAALAFLWPTSQAGFGGKVRVGSLADVQTAFDKKEPFYNASAKTYIVPYPKDDIAKAEQVYHPASLSGWRRATSRCTRSACTWAAGCRGARRRSGSSARVTARSTTGWARSAAGPHPAASTGSRSPSAVVASRSTPAR
jgi:hypothetical protein